MSKKAKIWLITATSLIIIGLIMFGAVMSVFRWDFTKLSTVKYETKTYEIGQKFSSIAVNFDTVDLIFEKSNDGACRLVCDELQGTKHLVEVQNGTLLVNKVSDKADKPKWYEFLRVDFRSPKMTLYLPDEKYQSLVIDESTGSVKVPKEFKFDSVDISLNTGDVNFSATVDNLMKIKTNTGDINIKDAEIKTLNLSVTTGEVAVSDVTCNHIISSGSTGDVSLKNVRATEKISLERSTGNIKFDHTDAAEIYVKTSTGDVTGSFLTQKQFVTKTSTGSVRVPKSASGGKCEIITSTGDINFH